LIAKLRIVLHRLDQIKGRDKLQKKTCLVTGAAGFLGSHLCEALYYDGHQVVGIDNLATGRIENLSRLIGKERFTFKELDIMDLKDGGVDYPFDWVFHLAALADIVPSIKFPRAYHLANVDGTVEVLEFVRRNHCGKILYAASSSCYGIPDQYPTAEATPARPKYPYALTKYIAEQYVMHWGRVYKIPAVSLRLFNVYGPRARTSGAYGAVMGTFLTQKYHGAPLTIVGDGEQKRDFTFVSDVVDAFVRAAASPVEGEIFNVSANNPRSVNLLASLLAGDNGRIVRIPERPGEPKITHGNTFKIREILGWEPKVSFEDGVKICLEHIEDFKDAPLWDERSIAEATRDWFNQLS
jgi:UDP-glucose 4-epimerase